MPRRSMQKRAPKLKPIERTMSFTLDASSTNYLDSGFVLSYMNRQAMKQGMEYVIQFIELIGNTGTDSIIEISTLSKNWVSANSWVKGFSHWKDQQDDFLREAGQESRKARYNDFKIFYDTGHWAQYSAATPALLPVNAIPEATAQLTDPEVQTEWDYSQVVVPNDVAVGQTIEYNLHMIGPDLAPGVPTSKSLIHNYALSRQRPHVFDPNQVAPSTDGGLYQDMVDVGDNLEEVGENVSTNNFVAPYLISGNGSAYEWYPGGENNAGAGSTVRDYLAVRGGTGSINQDMSAPFSALCGLIKIQNFTEAPVGIRVTWAAGEYKGVMARPM